jgi:hydroxyacylglutathione hydrolase
MLNIQAIPALRDNYIWLIHAVHSTEVLIVDPGEAQPVIDALTEQQLSPVAILNTHYHYDHIDGIAELVERYQLPVFGPSNAFIPKLSTPLSAGSKLAIHSSFPKMDILDIPGHTAVHIAYHFDDKLFCGDTLFAAGCGKLLGGTAEQLFNALQQLINLPIETKIYCGHEYTQDNLQFAKAVEPNNKAILQRIDVVDILREQGKVTLPSTLALELATNPFLRCDKADIIEAAEQFIGATLDSPLAVFKVLRAWKDRFFVPIVGHKKSPS